MKKRKDIIDERDEKQLKELDKAIVEVDNGETISWPRFQKRNGRLETKHTQNS